MRLNHGLADIAINWAGGLHHAKKAEASGFCYINDLVLAILELLKYHPRVLYIDIDIHHGDGVEEAFYLTDRVMTLSFHKYGDFFPGTGDIKDMGASNGKYYSVNVPLLDGMDDASYLKIFKPIVSKAIEVFAPGAIVLQARPPAAPPPARCAELRPELRCCTVRPQCGADSLAADRLGCFNLTLEGHAECVRYVKKFGLPLLVTGGGGYIKSNVARCWTNETAVLLNRTLAEDIPAHDFYHEYYAEANYKLKIAAGGLTPVENLNTKASLSAVKAAVMESLRLLEHAPGVQMSEMPPESMLPELDEDDAPDERYGKFGKDKEVLRDDEYYEDDADQDG